eukprot:GEMP01042592.1.p1 GENE.GEMP01042592.1~~GEMP01042592.1.p1  ORF type:complete len:369 (+),score=63.24 GEMP01042592.1:128-1234(+)
MDGFFEEARIDLTSIADGVQWTIGAKEVSYRLDHDGAIILRIVVCHKQAKEVMSDQSVDVAAAPAHAMKRERPHQAHSAEHCDDGDGETVAYPVDNACENPTTPKRRTQLTPVERSPTTHSGDTLHCAPRDGPYAPTPAVDQNNSVQKRVLPRGIPSSLRCNVEGCTRWRQGKVLTDDHFGRAGLRCKVHGAVRGQCNVKGCTRFPCREVLDDDCHGRAGPRCIRHDGVSVSCNVDGCTTPSHGKVNTNDDFGRAGLRCFRHGVSRWRCNVEDCATFSKGKVTTRDHHGDVGRRCVRHGAIVDVRHCSVEGCANRARRKVLGDDSHGRAGLRCTRHGAYAVTHRRAEPSFFYCVEPTRKLRKYERVQA